MGNKFGEFVMKFDIFGHPITVNFKGDDTYKTRLGVFFTFSIMFLIIFNFINLSTAFVDGSRQEDKTNVNLYDRHESPEYNLMEIDIEMALFASSID